MKKTVKLITAAKEARAMAAKPTPKLRGMMQMSAARVEIARSINTLAGIIHLLNDQWWRDLKTNRRIKRNDGEMIALMHSELSEALEHVRKSTMDDKLPHRKGVEVEMADCVIRIMDYCAGRGLDLGGALVEKCIFNANRADHQRTNRLKPNGKKI
jgi:NTP pyrophosphatase (non-canonical NTP hydrolase)